MTMAAPSLHEIKAQVKAVRQALERAGRRNGFVVIAVRSYALASDFGFPF